MDSVLLHLRSVQVELLCAVYALRIDVHRREPRSPELRRVRHPVRAGARVLSRTVHDLRSRIERLWRDVRQSEDGRRQLRRLRKSMSQEGGLQQRRVSMSRGIASGLRQFAAVLYRLHYGQRELRHLLRELPVGRGVQRRLVRVPLGQRAVPRLVRAHRRRSLQLRRLRPRVSRDASVQSIDVRGFVRGLADQVRPLVRRPAIGSAELRRLLSSVRLGSELRRRRMSALEHVG